MPMTDKQLRERDAKRDLGAELLQSIHFKEIVTAKADDIVKKWIDYFVLHKSFDAEQINRRLK